MRRRAALVGLAWPLFIAGLVAGGADATGTTEVMGPGLTRQVSLPGADYHDPRPADTPTISDDARYVAYMQQQYGDSSAGTGSARTASFGLRVWRRELESNDRTPLSGIQGDASQPSISGDGSRVSYLMRGSNTRDIVVARISPLGKVTRERVTSRPSDLPFQRTSDCALIPATEADTTEGECGPVLSGDGRSLAIPARQSIISPRLFPTVVDEPGTTFLDSEEHGLALIEFHSDQNGSTTDRRKVVVQLEIAFGPRDVAFGAPQVSGPFRAFVPDAGPSCAGRSVEPGSRCVIGVEFRPTEAGCGTSYGSMTVRGHTPEAETMVALVGDHDCTSGGSARQAVCPEPTGDAQEIPLHQSASTPVNFGELDLGAASVDNMEVNADYTADIEFTASDCSIQLVRGDPDPNSPWCFPGPMPSDGECIARVWFDPDAVGTSVATLRVVDGSDVQTFRYVGAGRRDVVVMRRDPTGSGFTGPGAPAARIVSVDADGEPMAGTAPSMSYDGRQLAFVSGFTRPWVGAPKAQVYVHDTDANDDGTWVSGETTNVSIVEGSGDEADFAEYAAQPSLSGDGRRIAFVEVIQSNLSGDTWVTDGSRVFVRDLEFQSSLEASAPPGEVVEEPGLSYSPALARDGSTVTFASDDFTLVPDGAEVEFAQVYVRDIGADLLDTVSLREDDTSFGHAGNPAISGDGGTIAFASSDDLVGPPPDQCCGLFTRQVFARTRFATPSAEPLSLSFPQQQLGSVGPSQTIVISNGGPGPMQVSTEILGGFVVTGGCETTVHRAESCELLVASKPRRPGERGGTLRIILSAGGWKGEVIEVDLIGYGVPPQFSLTPTQISFEEQGIGTSSEPVVVRAINVSDASIDLAATVVPMPEPLETPSGIPETPSDGAGPDSAGRATEGDAAEEGLPEEEPPVDFDVTAPDGTAAECDNLEPGGTCRLMVVFNPEGLGDRTGQLVITVGAGAVPLLQLVQLSGTTAEPEFTLSPTVAREGRVVFVSGSNFYPGQALDLDWSGGPLAVPTIVPDETGTFTAPVVVLPGRQGRHTLTLTMPDVASVEAPEILVVPGSLQPPDFVNRN